MSIAFILHTHTAHCTPEKMPKFCMPGLTVVLCKYQVFWEIQSPVTMDKVIGAHEYFKFVKEKVSELRL